MLLHQAVHMLFSGHLGLEQETMSLKAGTLQACATAQWIF